MAQNLLSAQKVLPEQRNQPSTPLQVALAAEPDVILRWDIETGWAHVGVPQPQGLGPPRFIGFVRLATGQSEEIRKLVDDIGYDVTQCGSIEDGLAEFHLSRREI